MRRFSACRSPACSAGRRLSAGRSLADTRRTHGRPRKGGGMADDGSTASALANLSEGQRRQAMDRFAMVRPPNFTPKDAPRSTRRRQAARRPTAATTFPPISIEPPGPRPFRPGPKSPVWPRWHAEGIQLRLRVSPQSQPHKLTVPPPSCWCGAVSQPRPKHRCWREHSNLGALSASGNEYLWLLADDCSLGQSRGPVTRGSELWNLAFLT
jgi:hypothetical protein